MKKFILIFLSVVCMAGVVALGYLIFNAKSIASIEIEGQIQTIYLAGQDIDFEDAKLKVTYKNGNVKFVDMKSKNVEVTQFSTSLKTHGKMKISYKSQILEVEYDVLESGMYYLSSEQSFYADGTVSRPIAYPDVKSSPKLMSLRTNGEVDYYYIDNGRYNLHDGSYDKSYRYDIVGDSINIYLGSTENLVSIKAHYESTGNVEYKFTRFTTDGQGLNISKNVKTYKHYAQMKSDNYRQIESAVVDTSRVANENKDRDCIIFERGDTLVSSGYEMFLIVNYKNDDFLYSVCVHICDGMIVNNSFDTSLYTSLDTMYIHYQKGNSHISQDLPIHYKVV